MALDAVLNLTRDRITLTEMCARTGVLGVRPEKLMEDDGCSRLDRFGWQREPALATLRRIAVDDRRRLKIRAVQPVRGL